MIQHLPMHLYLKVLPGEASSKQYSSTCLQAQLKMHIDTSNIHYFPLFRFRYWEHSDIAVGRTYGVKLVLQRNHILHQPGTPEVVDLTGIALPSPIRMREPAMIQHAVANMGLNPVSEPPLSQNVMTMLPPPATPVGTFNTGTTSVDIQQMQTPVSPNMQPSNGVPQTASKRDLHEENSRLRAEIEKLQRRGSVSPKRKRKDVDGAHSEEPPVPASLPHQGPKLGFNLTSSNLKKVEPAHTNGKKKRRVVKKPSTRVTRSTKKDGNKSD